MIIYKPDNKVFKSRNEAKTYLGTAFYQKMIREQDERLICIDDDCIAGYESIYKGTNQTEESNQ